MGRYDIKPADGSRRARKRVGRGTGSGYGKTAGKGTKGQKSRSGYKQRAWFEGGQMPLQRRVPKRGFTNIFKVPYQVVNLGDLERVKGDVVTKEILEECRLIRSASKPVKLLGNGDIHKKYDVTVDAFSASARKAIEDAGGTCTALEPPKPARTEKPIPKKVEVEAEPVAESTEPVGEQEEAEPVAESAEPAEESTN